MPRPMPLDPLETGPAQWRMAPSTGQAVVELDGEVLGEPLAIAEAITVVRWLNLGGLRDIQRPMAADIDTRDTAIAERDETIRELREAATPSRLNATTWGNF